MSLPLSPQVFGITALLIEERTGLHYDLTSLELLADKLSDRALELGLATLLDYYYYLRYDPRGEAELQALAETIAIHETFLFREVEPLRVLVQTLIPGMLRARRTLRIWSAACATGEEPYTLTMMLWQRGLLDSVEIVGSDLSERALSRARAGVYGGRALRNLQAEPTVARILEETPLGLRVPDALRRRVTFRQVNLLDGDAIRELGLFDVILCRNVLIYFSEATVGRVTASLGTALSEDGLLVVGASESLLRFGTMLSCEEHGGSFFYRKERACSSSPSAS